jgi:hypothetical protein
VCVERRARVFALNARAKDVVGPALLDDLRGRVPQTLLITATAVDPSGGGLAILSWVTYWPAFATVLGGIPLVLITRAGAGAMLVAAAWTVAATAALVYLLSRDPVET